MTAGVDLVRITPEQEHEIEARRGTLLAAAEDLNICDSDTEAVAWALVNKIGDLKKFITADFAPSKKASHAAWKTICDQEGAHLDKLKAPDLLVRQKLADWDAEKQRILREAQRRQQEEADRQAAEANRIAREQAEKEAEEKRLQAAIEAEQMGDKVGVEELLERPLEIAPVVEVVAPVIPQMTIPPVAGQGSMIEVWQFEVIDESQVPREYLIVDEKAVGKIVQAMKGRTHIPGVRVWSERQARRVNRAPSRRYQHHDDPPLE